MGHRSSKPIVKASIVERKLNLKEKSECRTLFALLAKSEDTSSGRISKEDFIEKYLKERLPHLSLTVLERLFGVLSYRGKDDLNFEELKHAKYLLDHSPNEPLRGEKDLYDLRNELYEDRLRLVFNLMDLNFDGVISKKEMKSIYPYLMIDEQRPINLNETPGLALWTDGITQFAIFQFDRSNSNQLNGRDFRQFAKRDQTMRAFMRMLEPKKDPFPTLHTAKNLLAIKRKADEKREKMSAHSSENELKESETQTQSKTAKSPSRSTKTNSKRDEETKREPSRSKEMINESKMDDHGMEDEQKQSGGIGGIVITPDSETSSGSAVKTVASIKVAKESVETKEEDGGGGGTAQNLVKSAFIGTESESASNRSAKYSE